MTNIEKNIIEYIKKYIENTERGIEEDIEQTYSYENGENLDFAFIYNKYTYHQNLRIRIDSTLDDLIKMITKNINGIFFGLIKMIKNNTKGIISHAYFNNEKTKVYLHYSNNDINIYIGIIQQKQGVYYIICKKTENKIYKWADEIARTEPFFDFNLSKDLIYYQLSISAISEDINILLDLFTLNERSVSFFNIKEIFIEKYKINNSDIFENNFFKYLYVNIDNYYIGAIIFKYNNFHRVSFICNTNLELLINILKRYVLLFADYQKDNKKLDNDALIYSLKLTKYLNVDIIDYIVYTKFNKGTNEFLDLIKSNNIYIIGTILFSFFTDINLEDENKNKICLYVEKDLYGIFMFIKLLPENIKPITYKILSTGYYYITYNNINVILKINNTPISKEFNFCLIRYNGVKIELLDDTLVNNFGNLEENIITKYNEIVDNNYINIVSDNDIIKILIGKLLVFKTTSRQQLYVINNVLKPYIIDINKIADSDLIVLLNDVEILKIKIDIIQIYFANLFTLYTIDEYIENMRRIFLDITYNEIFLSIQLILHNYLSNAPNNGVGIPLIFEFIKKYDQLSESYFSFIVFDLLNNYDFMQKDKIIRNDIRIEDYTTIIEISNNKCYDLFDENDYIDITKYLYTDTKDNILLILTFYDEYNNINHNKCQINCIKRSNIDRNFFLRPNSQSNVKITIENTIYYLLDFFNGASYYICDIDIYHILMPSAVNKFFLKITDELINNIQLVELHMMEKTTRSSRKSK